MRNFFHTKSFKLLLGVAVILLGLIIYSSTVSNSITANIINFISSPMQKISSSTTNSVSEAAAKNDTDALNDKVAQLEKENQEYRAQLTDYYDCKKQVEEYKKMLGIKTDHPDMQMLSAAVIARGSIDLFSDFSIDQGSMDGVSIGDPVITADGLVGWVSKVYSTTSVVTTIYSESTHIGASAKARRETGVIESNIMLADEHQVKLSFLGTETKVAEGDIITTTGLSGMFPKDVLVGKVVSIAVSDDKLSKYAIIKPYADIENLTDVFVVTNFYGKGAVTADTSSTTSTSSSSSTSNTTSTSSASSTSSNSSSVSHASTPEG